MAGAAEGEGRADQRLNEEELRFALESGQLGTWSLDRASSELTTSPTCRKNFGRDPERPFTYDELRAAVHPQDRDRMVSAVRDSLETGCDCDIVYRVITPAGEVRWLGIRARVSHLANGGAVRLAGVSQDITAQRQADRMRVALVALGDALRDLDDAAAIAHTAGRILGETLDIDRAGYGTVDPVEETITIERDWNAPGVESLAGTLHFRDYGHYVEDLVRGETVAFADAEVDPRTRANAAALEAINARAVVNMPVTERGRTVALFYLNHGAARVWTPAELAFLREVAERTRASSERRRAEVAVRASARRLAFLDALGRDSAEATDADAILALTTRRLGEYLGVSIAAYADMEDDQDAFTIRGDWAAPGSASIVGRYRLAAFGARAVRELGAGEPLIIHDNLVELPPEEAATFQAIGITATICMPLVKEGRLAALMAIHDKAPRVWSAEELALLREVTERSWAHVERVGAVSELRASEARLRVLNAELEQRVIERSRSRGRTWQVSPELLGVAGLDGHLEEVNPAWRTVLDWPADELLGRDVAQFVHPDDAAATGAVYDQLRDPVPPAVLRVDNRCRCRDGSYRWLSWLIVPDDGRLYLSARDVTEQKEAAQALAHAQASLRQSQKMEAVGQLTGGLAHDFNNLLAGISGSLEMMNTRISQGRLDAVERYFMAARGAVKRAAALTHRLLAFSRRQTLDPKPTDVNRLVSGMEELVRRTVGPSIELEVVGAAAVWPTLVDQNQLENALLNLCINARDAMPHGGRLTIETANRWLDERAAQSHDLAPGQYVSLSVTDTGTGMAPDVIAKAFDPFFTTKPLGEGTGLGLSMVYGFARQSGGQVRVYSELGSGTTMCVYLPRGATDAQAAAVEAPAPNPETTGKGETVLVVDDEPTIRMLVGEVLADGGYTAIEASDGPAALRILQSSVRIDLLITDVGLPGGLNGRQVADAAREARPGLHVIFITGYAENAALGGGYLERGMSLITKPFEIDTLARKIREAFDAARASRPGEASR
jgi:PAS domain S-box-containing protein